MPAESNETVYAIPGRWKDIYDQAEKNLKVLHAGVKLGTDKGKGLIPDQALRSLYDAQQRSLPTGGVILRDAIRYLRKEAVNLPADTPKGYVLVTYRQVPDRLGKEHWQVVPTTSIRRSGRSRVAMDRRAVYS